MPAIITTITTTSSTCFRLHTHADSHHTSQERKWQVPCTFVCKLGIIDAVKNFAILLALPEAPPQAVPVLCAVDLIVPVLFAPCLQHAPSTARAWGTSLLLASILISFVPFMLGERLAYQPDQPADDIELPISTIFLGKDVQWTSAQLISGLTLLLASFGTGIAGLVKDAAVLDAVTQSLPGQIQPGDALAHVSQRNSSKNHAQQQSTSTGCCALKPWSLTAGTGLVGLVAGAILVFFAPELQDISGSWTAADALHVVQRGALCFVHGFGVSGAADAGVDLSAKRCAYGSPLLVLAAVFTVLEGLLLQYAVYGRRKALTTATLAERVGAHGLAVFLLAAWAAAETAPASSAYYFANTTGSVPMTGPDFMAVILAVGACWLIVAGPNSRASCVSLVRAVAWPVRHSPCVQWWSARQAAAAAAEAAASASARRTRTMSLNAGPGTIVVQNPVQPGAARRRQGLGQHSHSATNLSSLGETLALPSPQLWRGRVQSGKRRKHQQQQQQQQQQQAQLLSALEQQQLSAARVEDFAQPDKHPAGSGAPAGLRRALGVGAPPLEPPRWQWIKAGKYGGAPHAGNVAGVGDEVHTPAPWHAIDDELKHLAHPDRRGFGSADGPAAAPGTPGAAASKAAPASTAERVRRARAKRQHADAQRRHNRLLRSHAAGGEDEDAVTAATGGARRSARGDQSRSGSRQGSHASAHSSSSSQSGHSSSDSDSDSDSDLSDHGPPRVNAERILSMQQHRAFGHGATVLPTVMDDGEVTGGETPERGPETRQPYIPPAVKLTASAHGAALPAVQVPPLLTAGQVRGAWSGADESPGIHAGPGEQRPVVIALSPGKRSTSRASSRTFRK